MRRAARFGLALVLALASMRTASAGFAPPVFIPIEGGGGSPVAIAAGDLDRDGHPDLVTANYRSGNVSVLRGDGTRRFHRSSPIPVGDGPVSVALGDVNGDGWLDVVTANAESRDVTVLLGAAGGTYAPTGGSPLRFEGFSPAFADAGDLNEDGKLDLVISSPEGDLILLVGDGAGGFAEAPGSRVHLRTILSSLALRDVNGDGRPDLVAVSTPDYYHVSDTITTLFGAGGFAFAEAPGSPARIATILGPSAFGDVDRDGKLDIVALEESGQDLLFLRGDGSGGFRIASRSSVAPLYSFLMVLLDANQDGVLDLATLDLQTSAVSIRLGNVDGGFLEPSQPAITVGADVEAVATGDLDADGRLDLVAANYIGRAVSFLRQDAAGRFSEMPGSPVAVGLAPTSLTLGPELGGRIREVVMWDWDGFVGVLLADDTGAFVPAPSPPLFRPYPITVVIADIDGDGWLDLVTRYVGIEVLLGRPDGSFVPATGPPVASVGTLPFLGDLTGDGRPDLVISSDSDPSLSLLRGDGRGGFVPVVGSPLSIGLRGSLVAAGDVNGDGKLDLVALGHDALRPYFYGWAIAVLLGDGSGGFWPARGAPVPVELPDFANVQAITASDLNGDGRTDLVLSGNGAFVLIGDGLGRFTPSTASNVSSASLYGTSALSISDLDGDGRPDLVISDGGTSRVALLYNTSMTPVSVTATAGTPQDVAVLNPLPTPLRVLVRDAAGSPVPDVVVTFDAPASGASGSFPGGAIAVTDARGEAVVPFTVNGTTGTYTVTASLTPFPVVPATFQLTNSEVSILAVPATISRGAASRATIAHVAARDLGRLTVTATFAPPGVTVTEVGRSGGEITATVSATCDAPLGPSLVKLLASDGLVEVTCDLVVEVGRDATPPWVLPSPAQVVVSQSTCASGGGATLASLAIHRPIEYQALRTFIENVRLAAIDNCTASPARLTTQKVANAMSVTGVDITDTTVFPYGSSFVRFRFRDDEMNIGVAHGLVGVYRNGDLDVRDGVSVSDTVILASYLVGNVEPGTDPFAAPLSVADVNADGVVDVFDLLLVASFIVGNVDCLAP